MVSSLIDKAFTVDLSLGLIKSHTRQQNSFSTRQCQPNSPCRMGYGNTHWGPCSDLDKGKIWIWVRVWTTGHKKLYTMYHSHKTALLQSQDWHVIMHVTCTLCFQCLLLWLKMTRNKKLCLEQLILFNAVWARGRIGQRMWNFHVRSPWNIFPISNTFTIKLKYGVFTCLWSCSLTCHQSHWLQWVVTSAHFKGQCRTLVSRHFRIFCLREKFILQIKLLL